MAALSRPGSRKRYMSSYSISIEPVIIDAPVSRVWSILTDLEHYPDWNPLTVKAESSLIVGDAIDLYIARGGKLNKTRFVLEVLETEKEIAWRLPKLLHPTLFRAYRTQSLQVLDERHCTYRTCDTFEGWMAGIIYKSQHEWVRKKFGQLSAALKARAESLNLK